MINDEKKNWEAAMSTGKYFGCNDKYAEDLIRRRGSEITDISLSAVGAISGIHQGEYREGFFDVKEEGSTWKMLEIGCGYGLYAAHFAPYVDEYIGVDVSETIVNIGNEALEEAEIHNAKLHVVAGCDLSFIPNNTIDLVFTAAVFIHTPLEVTKRYLEQTYTKLKHGGKFLHHFNMCTLGKGLHKPVWHVFTEDELDEMFEGILLTRVDKFDNQHYAKKQWMRYVYGVK